MTVRVDLLLLPLFQFNFLIFRCKNFISTLFIIFMFSPLYFIYLPFVNLKSSIGMLTRYSVNFLKITSIISGSDFFGSAISAFFVLAFLRFSFSGKGYRVSLSPKLTLTFSFGFSHLFYFYADRVRIILSAKTKGYLLGLNSFILVNNLNSLVGIKPINIFTWRGLRARRSYLRKKSGKVSLYM